MKYDRLYFTTGISDIDNAIGGAVDNGSCVVLLGNDVSGMLSFVEHNIYWGGSPEGIRTRRDIILIGSGSDIINSSEFCISAQAFNDFVLPSVYILRLSTDDCFNGRDFLFESIESFFKALNQFINQMSNNLQINGKKCFEKDKNESCKRKKTLCFLFYPASEFFYYDRRGCFFFYFRDTLRKWVRIHPEFYFLSIFVLYESVLSRSLQRHICCSSDILIRFKLSYEIYSVSRRLIVYHIKRSDSPTFVLPYSLQKNKIIVEKTKRVY